MTASISPMTPIVVASAMRPCAEAIHVQAHEERERDRHADREDAPRALLERVDDDEAEPGERDDDDEEDGDGSSGAGDGADLLARDLGERAAAAPGRGPQDDEVVHRAGETDADDQPDEPGSEAELRGEHRADERPGAGDRREVMPEEDQPVRRVVVVAVVALVRRRDPAVVERHHSGGDERAVVAVRDRQDRREPEG